MSEWKPYDGDYDKQFYEIRLDTGTVVPHCWPNAGWFNPDRGLPIHGNYVAEYRRCTCGHKLAGCTPE